jgi:hypothetical protein
MSTAAQIAANQQNAKKSTGPTSTEGKSASSRNNTRHGFRSKFSVLPNEDQTEFNQLVSGLKDEHKPAGITEEILIQRMAEHLWLAQRASYYQDLTVFSKLPVAETRKDMSLWMRYEATNQRAFHKCLNDLLKVKAERRKEQIGFERQKQAEAEQVRKDEAHEAKIKLATAKSNAIEIDTAIKTLIQAPLPGHTTFDLNDFKTAVSIAIRQLASEKAQPVAA